MPQTADDVLQQYLGVMEKFPNAEPRPVQQSMIRDVATALIEGKHLAIEAGTGAGKSFGYLIPALVLGKRPIVISTATIALQEQLIHKDLPTLIDTLGVLTAEGEKPNVKLVKGRGNYICLQKLIETEKHVKPIGQDNMVLNYIKGEWQEDWDGDIANLSLSIPPHIWNELRSDAEDCLGRKCQFFMDNPYRIARQDLEHADIIVVNHALYLQDVTAGNTLLPEHDIIIFDEAHQLKTYALGALTVRIGKYATTKLLQKIQRRLQPLPEHYIHLVSETEAALMEWLFRNKLDAFRLYPDDLFYHIVDRQIDALKDLENWLGSLEIKQLAIVETDLDADKASVHKNNLLNQLRGLILRWEYFLAEDSPIETNDDHPRVNWAEIDKNKLYYELRSTPLNVAPMLSSKLWAEKTTISTSATLSVNNSLSFFKSDLGLPPDSSESILASPFDYERQCALYLPSGMPDPNSVDYIMACAEEIERLLQQSNGRAFVLLTSYSAMKTISQALIPKLPYPCRLQGEMPRQRLIEWFKATPNSVIFATATFWEGIDIPGEALSCVIMDKIPFAPPGDPVNNAMVDYIKASNLRTTALQSQYRDWFTDFVLPQAIIKLKQGFGRLIRSKNDTGIVAILDPRLTSKGYGRVIRRSLPKTKVYHTIEALAQAVGKNQPETVTA